MTRPSAPTPAAPRSPRAASARALAALLVLALAPACRRHASHPAPHWIDRSDGAIPTLRAPHLAPGAIHIDGRLIEPAWNMAGDTGPFVSPGDGRPVPDSRVNGSARLAWDDTNLYVGFVVQDDDPRSPFQPADRDPHLWESASAVELMIQPGDPGDNREYYEIQVDTNGSVWDTRFDDYNRPIEGDDAHRTFGHQEWTSGIQRAALVDRGAGQYTIEMAIPWAQLQSTRTPSPPHLGDVWRINLYSFRDGQRDALAWSPLMHRGNFHYAARFGRVEFR